MKDRFYKAGSSIKLCCIISEEYASSLPTKIPVTTSAPTTTPSTTTTELTTTKLSTIINKLESMLNKSWSVETTTISSTVSMSTTTQKMTDITTMPTTVKQIEVNVVNNIYGLFWKKQGKDFFDNVTWQNLR